MNGTVRIIGQEEQSALVSTPLQNSEKVTSTTATMEDLHLSIDAYVENQTNDYRIQHKKDQEKIDELQRENNNLTKAISCLIEKHENEVQSIRKEFERKLLETGSITSLPANIYEEYNFRPTWFNPSATDNMVWSFIQNIRKLLERKWGTDDYLVNEKVCCCIVYHILTTDTSFKNTMIFDGDEQDFPVFWNELVEKTITDDARKEKVKIAKESFKTYINPKKQYREIMGNNPKSWKNLLINGKSRKVNVLRIAIDIYMTMKSIFHVE